jgi:Kdo2-lipid IVA lauroyltransferase/acyltransferase
MNLVPKLLLACLWLLHWLPVPLLRLMGYGFGTLLYLFAIHRRHIGLTNLALCFPNTGKVTRHLWVWQHMAGFCQAWLDRGIWWWASAQRIRKLVRVTGMQYFETTQQPLLILSPHFLGLDAAWARLTQIRTMASMYANQKQPSINKALLQGRKRFNHPRLLSRQEGIRGAVQALKDGIPFYYLPDLDYGKEGTVFAKFFGVSAATLPTVNRLQRMTHANLVSCISTLSWRGVEITLQPLALKCSPDASPEAAAQAMNDWLQDVIEQNPIPQYHWLHRRFKTQPASSPAIY